MNRSHVMRRGPRLLYRRRPKARSLVEAGCGVEIFTLLLCMYNSLVYSSRGVAAYVFMGLLYAVEFKQNQDRSAQLCATQSSFTQREEFRVRLTTPSGRAWRGESSSATQSVWREGTCMSIFSWFVKQLGLVALSSLLLLLLLLLLLAAGGGGCFCLCARVCERIGVYISTLVRYCAGGVLSGQKR